jgi:hypothetical protein
MLVKFPPAVTVKIKCSSPNVNKQNCLELKQISHPNGYKQNCLELKQISHPNGYNNSEILARTMACQ